MSKNRMSTISLSQRSGVRVMRTTNATVRFQRKTNPSMPPTPKRFYVKKDGSVGSFEKKSR